MAQARKTIVKKKNRSSILRNLRRTQENYKVLNELKDNET